MTQGFPISVWVYALAVLAAISICWQLATLWRKYRTARAQWWPLPNYYPEAKYRAQAECVTARELADALQAAESCLIAHTRWTAAQTASALIGVRVYVADSVACKGSKRRPDADIQVGRTLAALGQEMVILFDRVLGLSYGVAAALNAYDAWLRARGLERRSVAAVNFGEQR